MKSGEGERTLLGLPTLYGAHMLYELDTDASPKGVTTLVTT